MTARNSAAPAKPVRGGSKWRAAFYLGLALCALVVAANLVMDRFDATTLWGMIYGSAAALLMVVCALYAGRRRTMALGLGSARNWQQVHLYGGGLFFILVVVHTGFRWPQGSLNQWLFWLSAWVTVTGLIGVWIQYWIPRMLASGVATEVVLERIPSLVGTLRTRAEELVERCPDTVRDFYRSEIEPAMRGVEFSPHFVFDVGGRIAVRLHRFGFLSKFASEDERDVLRELESVYRTKLECDAQYTLQRFLRGWLWFHVPPSLALVGLVVLHVVLVFRY